MVIDCDLYGPFRETVGQKTVEVSLEPPTTVQDVLTALTSEHDGLRGSIFDADGELQAINVTVNKEQIEQLDGLDTVVTADDVIRIAPPIRGGTRRVLAVERSPRRLTR